ncbi:major facilitator superfamily transporter [Raoultella planticola]|uniref:Major facilitator superfamily transporter n=1 Tax=Raoultella planticola TaxID=575 RepID=A0A485BCS8_RAOPL|nr:major facilitator superfamily transporter [Raoultella planticola]
MPEPVDEPALNGVRLNLRIVSVVMFNFASYLTIGLPLAVLPGYVHDVMGFSAFWAGLVISLQYFATLLSRPHAGRYADLLGPKKIVIFGLCGCFLSGLSYLLAAVGSGWPIFSLALLCLGRVILGIGQSFAGTGSTLWGGGRGGLAAYRAGYFVERYRDLRGDGDGGAARRALLFPCRTAGAGVGDYGRGAGRYSVCAAEGGGQSNEG